MKWNIVKPALIVGLGALLFAYIEHNFTFNFVALFIVLLAMMGVLLFVKDHRLVKIVSDGCLKPDFERIDNGSGIPKNYKKRSFMLSYLMIILFGALAIYTFSNYVNPDKHIFYNYDHHAIKVEGVKVHEGFMVAGNEGHSFLDNSTIPGAVSVASYNNDEVVLQLNGVTVPIYTKEYNATGAPLRDSCINRASLFSHEAQNAQGPFRVSLMGRHEGEDGNLSYLDLEVEQGHKPHGLIDRGKDSTLYIFCYGDRRDTSSFNTFLKKGHELQSIARDAFTKMDLSGVNIIRPVIHHNLKNRELEANYGPYDYLVALEKQSDIRSIGINGSAQMSVDRMHQQSVTATIPYGRAFYIGSGKNATVAVKFEKINEQEDGSFEVAIMYELPRYQSLSSTNRGKETTLMVTSSIINAQDDPEASGLINNITDNLVLFDLFENHGNDLNIEPFFLSYISDISNVEMAFRLLTDGGATVKSGIRAGEEFPRILSRDGEHEWIVSVENFKETTPFPASKLVWVLVCVIAASVAMMYFSSLKNLYTSVECAAYLLLIAYLTVKLFLLWRVTVFSPVSSISFYEFSHFRDPIWLSSIIYALVAFYVGVGVIKCLILHPIAVSDFSNIRVFMRYAQAQPSVWNRVLVALCLLVAMCAGGIGIIDLYSGSEGVTATIVWVVIYAISALGASLLLKKYLPGGALMFAVSCICALSAVLLNVYIISPLAEMVLLIVAAGLCLVRYAVVILSRMWLSWVVFVVVAVIAAAYVFLEHLLNMPMVRVLGGALIYFTVDWFIYKMFAEPYDESIRNINSDRASDNTAFVLSVWNMLCMSAATLYADGGYGIMFTLFMIFAVWIKIVDVSNYTNYNHIRRKWVIPTMLSAIMVALVGVIFSYKRIFLELYNAVSEGKEWQLMLLGVVALLVLVFAVMGVLNIKGRSVPRLNERISWAHLIIPVAAVAAVVLVINHDILEKFTGGHTEYRIRVHMEKSEEVLAKVENASEQNRFLQASLNDWILYEYQNIGSEIEAFGEDGNGYFKLQPQSKIGAMWFAQTTDICLSRYIIAEHGMWLAWLFVLSFTLFLLIALQSLAVERWARMITIQVAMLFAVQALMILLANTRAFIFFGQDFPLISITSRVAAWYFTALMAICVVAALWGKRQYNELMRPGGMDRPYGCDEEAAITTEERNKSSIYFICLLFIVSAVVLYNSGRSSNNATGLVYDDMKKGMSPKEIIESYSVGDFASYHDGVYDIEFLMALVNSDLDTHITPALKSYQRTLKERVPLKRDMSAFVDSLFRYDTMQMALDKCDQITTRLLNAYRESGSKNNRASNVICLRNVRTIDYKKVKGSDRFKVVYQDTLEFAMGVNAVNYQMPNRRRSQWCGSIVEDGDYTVSDSLYFDENGVLFIPKSLTGAEDMQLVKADGNKQLTVIGSDGIIALSTEGVDVVNVRSSDYVIDGARGTLTNLPLQRNDYFAKNILINGNRAFLYPFGHKMFWARDIVANFLTMFRMMEEKDKLELANRDIVLSVNSDLTSQIYSVYRTNLSSYDTKTAAADRAVIVADGDGKVRAMVDYRFNDKYRINPNDHRRIAKISDSLFINFEKGRASETRYFGNFARNVLRRGPGSTQKPIVWTAVTTMYNTGWWPELKLVRPVAVDGVTKFNKDKKDYYVFGKYAGHTIERSFMSLYGDEVGNKDGLLDIQWYMRMSSNYYNSVMAYIGSFTKEDLMAEGFVSEAAKSNDNSTLFYTSSRPNAEKPQPQKGETKNDKSYKDRLKEWEDSLHMTFPEVKIKSVAGSKTLSFNRFLSNENAKDKGKIARDTKALLPQGLSLNFDLPLYVDADAKRPSRFFNIAVRKGRSADRQLNEYMVRSVAIGNSTVWNVSPFDMAQMYGRLVTLNRSYTLSLYSLDERIDAVKESYTPFNLDTKWKGVDGYLEVRNELIKGMSSVFSNGTAAGIQGTDANGNDSRPIVREYNVNGHKFVIKVDDGGSERNGGDVKCLYIYGKTGTINGYWNGVDKEDHLLATIITDRKLTQCSAEELESVKYYVIYQVDYEYSGNGAWKSIDGAVIRRVIESTEFMEYMGIK